MTQLEILNEIARVVCETFGVDGIEITRATVATDVPGWDSLSHTILMMSLERAFRVELPQLTRFDNIGELADDLEGLLRHAGSSSTAG